jgi:glycerophosphoryl diester phosphodiesterase
LFVKSTLAAVAVLATLAGTAAIPAHAEARRQAPVVGQPLAGTHAHNDYEHDRPLFDALEHGFTSVEADVWLVDGELRVAHDLADARQGVTLESLYLDPLEDLVRSQPGHSVYPRWDGSLQLLIDIKSEGEATYAAIEQELSEHRSADLTSGLPAALMPLISDNWTKLFTWQGVGPMPEAERAKLHAFVAAAHTNGYRVRFWATPDQAGEARDAVWTVLADAGVDHINTDDLAGLQRFLTARTQ